MIVASAAATPIGDSPRAAPGGCSATRHVVVNGQVTVKDGALTGARNGRVLRLTEQ